MKNFYLFLMIAGLVFVSCSEKPADKLETQAKESLATKIKSIGDDNENVKVENIKTVYASDSLCIMRYDIKGKMGIGMSDGKDFDLTMSAEYIYLSHDGKFYDASQLLSDDSIFVSKATMDKIKKGKIYENLSYEDAIMYRAIMYINARGEVVGDENAEVNIPNPMGTGLWELDAYNDEFGEATKNKYLRLTGKGTFSNRAATGERLRVHLFADKDVINFRFVEYDSSVVKEDGGCDMKIKDANGDVHDIRFYCTESGYIYPDSDEFAEMLKKIVKLEGIVSVSAEISNEYSSRSTYKFKLYLDGYSKAMSLL